MKPQSAEIRRAVRTQKMLAHLGSYAAPTRKTLIISALPGVDALEGELLLANRTRSEPSDSFWRLLQKTSIENFEISYSGTFFDLPKAFWEGTLPESRRLTLEGRRRKHEAQFEAFHMASDDERARYLLRLGLDFRGRHGPPLLCTQYLSRPAEGAAKGLMGNLPGSGKLTVIGFANKLTADVEKWMKGRK